MKLCRFYRYALSWAIDSNFQVPRWIERHSRSCTECRRFQQAEQQLIEALMEGAGAQRKTSSPFLHAGIISMLDTQAPKAAARAPFFNWVRAALIPALGVLLIAASFVWKAGNRDSATPDIASSVPVLFGQGIPQPDPSQFLAWTEKLDQPLESELDFVMRDARAALKSLTEHFVPAELLAKNEL